VSLMQAALDLQAESLVSWLNAREAPADVGARRNIAGWYYPAPYGVYATRDGALALSLAALPQLADALDEPRLRSFSEKDAWSRRDQIADLIAQRLQGRATAEWISRLESGGIWHARVQAYSDIIDDPQVNHMRALVRVAGGGETGEPVTLLNHALRYDREAAAVGLPPQRLGAQTREVLEELGLDPEEIAALAERGVIRLDDR
jgi:crotonobetainyl-CoA:carnitine CoA-transferase CaiB-like acyl-CoA transferase